MPLFVLLLLKIFFCLAQQNQGFNIVMKAIVPFLPQQEYCWFVQTCTSFTMQMWHCGSNVHKKGMETKLEEMIYKKVYDDDDYDA